MRIVGIDYPCMDMGVFCEEIPADGGLSVMQDTTLMGGGKIPNALVAAARLGAEASMLGACGDDRYGIKCCEDLEFNGVSTKALVRKPGRTALCICIADQKTGGKRCIESPATYARLRPEELDAAQIEGADMLLLYEMDETAVAAAKIAKAHGVPVLVDGDEFDPRTQENLALIDVLIMSEYYYGAIAGDNGENYEAVLRQVCDCGPRAAVVTLGANGCAGVGKEGFFRLPACSGYPVIDTTGAGDVFHGAFAYYDCAGWNAEECCRRASAVSYIKCSRLGGRTAIPTASGVEAFLQTGVMRQEDFDKRTEFYRNAAFT